jgi:tetratricopeptide (TPR) repeat protein
MQRRRRVATFLAIVALTGCWEAPSTETALAELPPLPPGLDPLVAAAIDGAREAALPPSGDPADLGNLCRVYHANKLFEHARRCYEQAALAERNVPEWSYLLGVLAAERGVTPEAIRRFRATVKLAPGHARARLRLGSALLDAGELDAAADAFREYNELAEGRAEGWVGLGQIERRRGDPTGSIAHFERAVELAPDHRPAYYHLSSAYRIAERHADADAALERFRSMPAAPSPEDAWLAEVERHAAGVQVMARQAATALEAGRFTEAEAAYAQVLTHAPDDFGAHLNLGIVYFGQQRIDEAERQFRRSVSLMPDNAQAHYGLARCLLAQSRATEAQGELREVLRLEPDHGEARALMRRISGSGPIHREATP